MHFLFFNSAQKRKLHRIAKRLYNPEPMNGYIKRIFYNLKPIVPRSWQILFRRQVVRYKRNFYSNIWPIDEKAAKAPEGWPGWPGKKRFALVLQHDVENKMGQHKCRFVMEVEEKLGFRSSFYFVPERYEVSLSLRHELKDRGFEVGVHGLKHDGRLFISEKIFRYRAKKINKYLQEWKSTGFSSPSMHHNLEWMHYLNILHGTTTFDTDPFEPQSDGIGTIFPFWVSKGSDKNGYLELPYTLAQDHSLFIIMEQKDIRIWQKKLDWIAENGGMALLNTHPDYQRYNAGLLKNEEYPSEYYEEFLKYVKTRYEGQYWSALPSEVARFWSENMLNSINSK